MSALLVNKKLIFMTVFRQVTGSRSSRSDDPFVTMRREGGFFPGVILAYDVFCILACDLAVATLTHFLSSSTKVTNVSRLSGLL